MPFGHPTPRQPEQTDGQAQAPLLRAGGLYPSKSGKAITGNIRVDSVRRNETEPFGEILIEMIRDAMEKKVPLRALVFESNGKFPNSAPYSLQFVLGDRPYDDTPEQKDNGWGTPEVAVAPADQDGQATPPPRPQRRAAPRR